MPKGYQPRSRRAVGRQPQRLVVRRIRVVRSTDLSLTFRLGGMHSRLDIVLELAGEAGLDRVIPRRPKQAVTNVGLQPRQQSVGNLRFEHPFLVLINNLPRFR